MQRGFRVGVYIGEKGVRLILKSAVLVLNKSHREAFDFLSVSTVSWSTLRLKTLLLKFKSRLFPRVSSVA